MKYMNLFVVSVLMLVSQYSLAIALPVEPLSAAPLPLDIGGIVAIGTVSLIIGAQLIKRKK